MSTKPVSTKAAARAAAATRQARRRFSRLLFGAVAALAVVVGALTAANFAQAPRVNTTSDLDPASATADFDIYSLHRGQGSAGTKQPDTVRGGNLSGPSGETTIVSAPRIQEFVALPSALAVVSLNDDDTSSLEIVPFSGGPTAQVPLPTSGTVENLHVSRSKRLIGYSFTSAAVADGYWKSLFVYDVADPSGAPREVKGIDGLPISVYDLTFVPDTTSLVVQTDDRALSLVDLRGTGTVTPLGLHDELRGFIPGTTELVVADRKLNPTTKLPDTVTSTIELADGTVTPLDLPESARSSASYAGKTVVLDAAGRYAQVSSVFSGGKESSVIIVTATDAPKVAFEPEPAWSRILDFCVSPDGKHLAVETTSPDSVSDNYPNLPAFSPVKTVLVDLATGADVRSISGLFASWCG